MPDCARWPAKRRKGTDAYKLFDAVKEELGDLAGAAFSAYNVVGEWRAGT